VSDVTTQTVWLIESGDYSDYWVHGVALTEAEAVAVCEKANRYNDRFDHWTHSKRAVVTADDLVLARHCYDTDMSELEFVVPGGDLSYMVAITDPEVLAKIEHDNDARRKAEQEGLT